MSDPHQTPLQEAISFLTIASILVAVGCYVATLQNIPVASPALFWVASIGLPVVSGPECCQSATDADARERGSDWRHFLCCDRPVRWLASCVVLKRANGKPGAADGKAPAQPSQSSKGAPQSRSIRCQINLTIS